MRISDWSSDVCSSDLCGVMSYEIVEGIGEFPVHVIDRLGLPHSELTLYACTANQIHSPKTARAYLREIVAYASWAETNPIVLRQNWQLLGRSEEHTSELQSLMRISYAVFCLKK